MGSVICLSRPTLLGCALLVLIQNAGAAATFTTFRVPGSTQTVPSGINSVGDVTGTYTDSTANYQGFLRTSNGTFTTFSVAGATSGTYPAGINSSGEITGYFNADSPHGFLRARDGAITIFNLPGSSYTTPTCINSLGDVAGYYYAMGSSTTGFIRASDGTVTTFGTGEYTSFVTSINDTDDVTGNVGIEGFVKLNGGAITSINVASKQQTFPSGINNSGTIAGSAYNQVCRGEVCLPVSVVSFVRTSDGTITPFNVPLTEVLGTYAVAINASGVIAGYYYRGINDLQAHGYMRDSSGKITTFDPPLSATTYPTGINDSGAIAGYVVSVTGTNGFIRNP